MNKNSKNDFFVTVILMLVILFIVGFGVYNYSHNTSISTSTTPVSVACTLEAKLCPDGSTVSRTGPNCDFAECPVVAVPATWKTFSDPSTGVTYKYPETLDTTYVRTTTTDWPPKVQVLGETPTCTEAGNPTSPAGITKLETINNRTYCVTQESEGAAGSIYNQYAYGVFVSGKYVILTFTLQYPQCVNYPDPKKSQCQIEETGLDVGKLVDQIVSTLNINP